MAKTEKGLSALEKSKQIENLILQLASGEKSAIEELYSLIKTEVFAFALIKTKNRQDASDILQDTVILIYKNAKLYKPLGKPMAWITTIANNLIKRHFVLQNRSVSMEEVNVIGSTADVAEKVANNNFLQALLSNLNDEQMEIIVLHVVSGFKFREIAKMLNKSISTVLSIYNRAIKKLRSMGEFL